MTARRIVPGQYASPGSAARRDEIAGTPPGPVHAVIVTHNCERYIAGCLDSLRREMSDGALTITVVDNNSVDGTTDRIRRDFPEAEVVCAGSNLGFARGANRGAARRRPATRWLLLLNPDIRLEEGSLRSLLATAERLPAAGIYGGQARDEHGTTIQSACLARPSLRQALAWATRIRRVRPLRWLDPDEMNGWARDSMRSVPVLAGALLLIDCDLWERLGGFDEAFVLYGEDVDLCLRARHLGASPFFCAHSRYVHVGSTSVSPTEKAVLILRGKAELYRRRLSPLRGALAVHALRIGVAGRAAFVSSHATEWDVVWASRAQWVGGFTRGCTPRVALASRGSSGRRPAPR